MHRRPGGILRHPDHRQLGVGGIQETDPLPIQPDSSRHQIGIQGQGIAVAMLDPRDLAGAFKVR